MSIDHVHVCPLTGHEYACCQGEGAGGRTVSIEPVSGPLFRAAGADGGSKGCQPRVPAGDPGMYVRMYVLCMVTHMRTVCTYIRMYVHVPDRLSDTKSRDTCKCEVCT